MVVVSISAYQDRELLQGALESVRDVLGNVRIQVVDGRYETFRPTAADNSTDDMQAVCDAYGAEYWPDGPYEREREKHVHRVELAPDGERALFMDADERLHAYDGDALNDDEKVAYSPRIANALVYGPTAVYWPRLFYPETVHSVNRWDAYLFESKHENTDAVTIIHRHDLRDEQYRIEKYHRFDREDRTGRFQDRLGDYLQDDWELEDLQQCPNCGADSVTTTQWTSYGPGDGFSRVAVCVNGDRCHAQIDSRTIDEYRYLPDRVEAGLEEAPERLRLELLDAGCPFLNQSSTKRLSNLQPSIELWLEDTFERDSPKVFG